MISKGTSSISTRSKRWAPAAFSGRASDQDSGFGRFALYAGAGAAALWAASSSEAENCGIVGIVSDSGEASDFLLEGLTILQV